LAKNTQVDNAGGFADFVHRDCQDDLKIIRSGDAGTWWAPDCTTGGKVMDVLQPKRCRTGRTAVRGCLRRWTAP
jgi:hypothetical protein